MRKSYPPTAFEPAAFELLVHCSTTSAREDVPLSQKARKRLNIKTLACKRQNIAIKIYLPYVIAVE